MFEYGQSVYEGTTISDFHLHLQIAADDDDEETFENIFHPAFTKMYFPIVYLRTIL